MVHKTEAGARFHLSSASLRSRVKFATNFLIAQTLASPHPSRSISRVRSICATCSSSAASFSSLFHTSLVRERGIGREAIALANTREIAGTRFTARKAYRLITFKAERPVRSHSRRKSIFLYRVSKFPVSLVALLSSTIGKISSSFFCLNCDFFFFISKKNKTFYTKLSDYRGVTRGIYPTIKNTTRVVRLKML